MEKSLIKETLLAILDASVAIWYYLCGWCGRLEHFRHTLYSMWVCRKYGLRRIWFHSKVSSISHTKYMAIGENTSFGRMAVVNCWPKYREFRYSPFLSIGKDCNFGDFIHITCMNRITIGNNVLTGRWVTITDNGHGTTDYDTLKISPIDRELYSKGPVVIGDKVWIGDKATILPGVNIGNNSIIAANSVVTQNIPPYSVVAGNPAKIIKQYIND